ncbi:glycosyltransferase family 39 protein [Candidatus Woesearchaeota archaeon]|nr:glycosyltransferase family 39 protein [Candidatus Woesearchaeota archaeon]
MKIRKSYIEILAFLVVYLFTIYMWTLPFQDNKIPYGEFDAISHWEIADSFAQRDNTYVYLPPFVDYSYGNDNRFKPHTLWYHPPFHTDLAMISAFANDRMVPIYLTNAIFASSILVSVFFVIRRLFGFLPALLSSFMLSFSMRGIMPYLWGQWPERFAYAFIPLILYCFYMYFTTYSKEKSKPVYLYIMALLLAINMMIHPLAVFHSLLGIFVLGIALAIKLRKFPFNLKHLGIAMALFLVLFTVFPYQTGNVFKTFTREQKSDSEASFSRLFRWSFNAEDFTGSVPPEYFSFSKMHGLWTLPFLLIGILALALRRQNRDLFLLAWLFSLYLVLHRDIVGKAELLHRSLSATAHIFIPITVLGVFSIASFIKIPKLYNSFLKYGAAALIVVLTLIYNMPQAYSTLDQAYDSPIIRLTPAQVEVSEWLKDNIDENQNVSVIGQPSQIMQKVWWMASFSHRVSNFFEGFLTWRYWEDNREVIVRDHILNDVIVMDYTDLLAIGNKELLDQWSSFEKQNLANHTLLYDRENIRVYKYEP